MADESRLRKSWPVRRQLCMILAAGLLMRLLYHLTYRPWWCGDSVWFTSRFWMWTHGYYPDGWRPPVYPLFLGLMEWVSGAPIEYGTLFTDAAYAAVIAQSALGLCSIVLIYDIMRRLGVRARLAFWGALCFALIGALSWFEMLLLSESLAAFFLTLSCWLLVWTIQKLQHGEDVTLAAVLTGLGLCAAVLVRAEMLVFAVIILGCIALVVALVESSNPPAKANKNRRPSHRQTAQRTFRQSALTVLWLIPLAAAPGILGWMYLTYLGSGQFRLTTIMGYEFNQTVYNLYDRVSPEDRALGQIMVKYYHQFNQGATIRRDYMWHGLSEIYADQQEMPIRKKKRPVYHPDPDRFGEGIAVDLDLGDYMGEVAWKLAKRYPFDWLHNVASSFFHDTFNFKYKETAPQAEITLGSDPRSVDMNDVIRYPALWRITVAINRLQAPFLCALYACTLVLSVCGPIWLLRNARADTTLIDGTVVAMAMATVLTFFSFCVTMAFYSEYGVSFLGIMLVAFTYTLERFLCWHSARTQRQLEH